MAEVLTKTVKEAKDMISKVRHFSQKILILYKYILSQSLCQADKLITYTELKQHFSN